jgi:pseudaminic acid synthase
MLDKPKKFSQSHRPYVVAELSANHNGSLENALYTIDAAAEAGVDAIKLQTYRPDTMTIDVKEPDFRIDNPTSPWSGQYLYDLYKIAHTPWEWHGELFKRAREREIECFSTPFDLSAIEFLEQFDPPFYKIASFENNHLPLLERVAKTGKPVLMSCGTASLAELTESVQLLKRSGAKEIVLLKCTSAYPSTPKNANIRTIPHMRELFGVEVGVSDHTAGIGVAVAAVAQGAVLVEKHFTLDRGQGGPDASFSMEPAELIALVDEVARGWESLGSVEYGISKEEEPSLVFRRSIYATADIACGDRLDSMNVSIIRPGYGLHPRFLPVILGKTASKSISKGTPISWECLLGG